MYWTIPILFKSVNAFRRDLILWGDDGALRHAQDQGAEPPHTPRRSHLPRQRLAFLFKSRAGSP
jgi:hypothetical protein